MNKYETLYETDSRFKRYVDADMKSSGRTKEETLLVKVVQNVGDMYMTTPEKEEPITVKNDDVNGLNVISCGGC